MCCVHYDKSSLFGLMMVVSIPLVKVLLDVTLAKDDGCFSSAVVRVLLDVTLSKEGGIVVYSYFCE